MAYRYHPEIEGLKVNEDGSEVIYLGERLEVKQASRSDRKNEMKYVYFLKRTHSVAKLVCECWHGMAENPRWCATRKVKENGFHYTNLYFAPCGTNPAMGTKKVKRSKLSKLSEADVIAVQKRLKKGDTLKSIANDYNTSDMTISRIKRKMNA